nr:PREDICTED: myosin regulatory light polypeptide 9-like [Bemisia tabaci]XP_018896643.1 PREDICTED: myosin regulatory light polypeptide 9-like [Bemisia tabaci]XP_018896644.1 PREDICTED: myosin regulatory light polypeptide 9-like [Bemisia tabaci]
MEEESEKKKVKGRFKAVAQIEEPEVEITEEPKPVRLGKFQAIVQVGDEEEDEPEVEETKVVVRRPMFTATVEADCEEEEEEREEEEPVAQFQCRIAPAKSREKSPEDEPEDWDFKLQQLKEAFFMFDFNQDGVIDRQDLKMTMAALGQDADSEEIDKMMEEANEPLTFDSFVTLFGQKKLDLDGEDVLREALSKWDTDNSGLISMAQLQQDLMTWGDKFTAREVELALEEAPIIEPGGSDLPVAEPMMDYIKFCTQLSTLRDKKQ